MKSCSLLIIYGSLILDLFIKYNFFIHCILVGLTNCHIDRLYGKAVALVIIGFFFFGATFFLILSSTAISDYRQSLQFQSLNEEKRNIHLQVCFYDFLWSPLSLSLSCYFSFWLFIWRYASIGYSKWQKNWGLYIWHNSWWCCASQHRWSGTCFVLVLIVACYSCVLNIFLTWHSKSLHRFLPMEYWFLVTLSQLMKQVWSQLMNQVLELEGERLWAFLPILYFELIFIILFFVFKEYFFQVLKDFKNPFLFSGFEVADGSGTMLVK